jgi:hypothetical protein
MMVIEQHEEARIGRVVLHVAHGEDVHHQPDGADQQGHQRAERVDIETEDGQPDVDQPSLFGPELVQEQRQRQRQRQRAGNDADARDALAEAARVEANGQCRDQHDQRQGIGQ